MKKIVSSQRMKELDQYTIQVQDVPSMVLMERAALAVVTELEKTPEHLKKILVLCGGGNNGGDGYAIARLLHLRGYKTHTYLVGDVSHMTEETKHQKKIAQNYMVPSVNKLACEEYTTIVDAIFGVGLSRTITGNVKELIEQVNQANSFVVAVDLPSGVHGTDGKIMGTAVKAQKTVTFAYQKSGQCLYPGKEYCGDLVVCDIGIYDDDKKNDWKMLEIEDLAFLADEISNGNKSTFGKVLCVAGSPEMSGAAFLSAKAALTVGAGMVKVQTAEENQQILQTLLPEAMTSVGKGVEAYTESADWCDVMLLGPGLGKSKESAEKTEFFLRRAYQEKKPVVIDADGLNLLSENKTWYSYLGRHSILTPHMGEFSRLTGYSIADLQRDRISIVKEFAKEHQVFLILKDASTVTATPDGEVYFYEGGNRGMATAGSGDVLAGIVTGLLATEHKKEWDNKIPAAAVLLHGMAGEKASKKLGKRCMTAGNMIEYLRRVIKKIEEDYHEDTF